MKQLFNIAVISLICLMIASCGQKQKTQEQESQEFRAALTETDTTEMLQKCNECMELLQKKDIEGALAMLKEYDDSTKTVSDLSAETRQRYTRLFTLFPVLKYNLSNFTFMMEGLNDVKYEVIFAEESNPEVNGEPKTFFMFNPVRVDDQWYVTVKRGDQSIHN
jgi:hypothetical protein